MTASVGSPSGLAVGNLMVVGLMLEKGSAVTVTPPSGWTPILATNATTNYGMRSYWKIAVAGDIGATFMFGMSTSGKYTISNSRFSNFNSANPIQNQSGAGSVNNSSGITTAPTLTTTVNNTLVLAFFGIKKNVSVNSIDGTLTQRHFLSSNDVTNLMATFVQGFAGATGNKTATFSQSEWRVGQQIAINTAPVICTPPVITSATNIAKVNDVGECSAGVTLNGSNITATGSGPIAYSYAIGMTPIMTTHEFPVGTTIVTVTATNPCGSDTENFNVIVSDTEAPVLTGTIPGGDVGNVCQDDAPDAPSEASIAALFTDNCGTVVVDFLGETITGDDCDWSVSYTYSVEDQYGNAASNVVVTYTGGDTEAPEVITMDITVYLDSYGNATIDDDAVDNGSNDNCSETLIFELSQTTFDCSDLGDNEVVLTVTDECGLSNTGTATVTVVLNPPVWQSSQTAVGIGSTNPTVAIPVGTEEDDLLVVGLMIEKGTATTITPPAGWTLIRRTNETTNTGMATYYKVATASEPASYTFTVTNSPKWGIGISRILNADPLDPIVIHDGAFGGQVFNVVAPSITPTVCNTLVMAFYSNKKNATFTPADGTTERYDVPNNSEGQPSNMLATYVHESGPTGTKTAIASEKEYWVAQQVSIRPAGGMPMMVFSSPVTTSNPIAGVDILNQEHSAALLNMDIYPNPADAELNIDVDRTEMGQMDITVFDLFGKQVLHETHYFFNRVTLDISGLIPGMYMVRMNAEGQSTTKKMLINR